MHRGAIRNLVVGGDAGAGARRADEIAGPRAEQRGIAQREARIRRQAEAWAREFDAHSLVVLRKASVRFDAQRDFNVIRAKVLYVISRTDQLFPPSMGARVMGRLQAAGVEATYVELDSNFGHLASGREADQWAPALQAFLERLTTR